MQVIHEVLQEMLVIKTLINKNRDLLHLKSGEDQVEQ